MEVEFQIYIIWYGEGAWISLSKSNISITSLTSMFDNRFRVDFENSLGGYYTKING